MNKEITRWEATGTPGLYVRQPGGGFYARITLNGKRSWRSLKTSKLREAQKLLRALQDGHARQVTTRSDDKLHAAMVKVMEFRSVRRGMSRPLKSSTVDYHAEILASARRLLPDRHLAEFDALGLLKAIQGAALSQSRRKAVFELVKRTFSDAVENGTVKRNPLAGHIPGQVPKKDRTLPTRGELDAMVETVKTLFPRYGHRAAFTLRFLAFSGMRINEARAVTWGDVGEGKIIIRGGDEGLKARGDGQTRILHINPPLQSVLDEIAAVYGRDGRVMPAKGIRPHLKAACESLGIPAMDHHDVRAWFITWNITAGTDVATLAGWVGNSPKVLLERYAAVQDELRKLAATKLA